MSQNHRAAFTLIELLVVISIMGLSFSVVTINYFRALQKQTLYNTGNQIEAMLRDAQVKAQSGYLGNNEQGYCDQLANVQVQASNESGVNVFRESLQCATNGPIVVSTIEVPTEYTLTSMPTVQYLPQGGVNLGGADQINFVLGMGGDYSVSFALNRGGAITVEYKST